ncbi:hypothetical protein [Dulcicalothrix desertica]|uniref:hypothetical protein n=1 Tax=Dulcicalothrix desertica TaxID=32056 RepID=UPI000F8C9AC7|nr:hypothetical protein [Dulcicalothrix desertica]TWH54776.1 hypothetical protein CAL7102_02845 [Dulcicalothrix desertica PCC 7102]
MKNNLPDNHNLLFRWACRNLKYFLLTLFGFVIACVVSQVFGASAIVQILSSLSLWEWLGRAAVFIFCFFGVAIIYESSR